MGFFKSGIIIYLITYNSLDKRTTERKNKSEIIFNLKDTPFVNENIIMDLVKDGQITKQRIEQYFKIKSRFNEYITMRITFFEKQELYEPLKNQLLQEINIEIKKL